MSTSSATLAPDGMVCTPLVVGWMGWGLGNVLACVWAWGRLVVRVRVRVGGLSLLFVRIAPLDMFSSVTGIETLVYVSLAAPRMHAFLHALLFVGLSVGLFACASLCIRLSVRPSFARLLSPSVRPSVCLPV